MTKTYLKLAGAVALTALAGCSGGGGIDMGPVGGGGAPPEPEAPTPNAVGYSATVNSGGGGWQSEEASALFTGNPDGSKTVKIVEGADAGYERTFESSSSDGGTGDSAAAYMTTWSYNGEEVLALIDAYNVPDTERAYYAFRSTEGMTENMPTGGTAHYEGKHSGFGTQYGSGYGPMDGTFRAAVNFDDASLEGSIYIGSNSQAPRVVFDGVINGPEFKSVPGTIAYQGRRSQNHWPAIIPESIDQNNSVIEGAFYGDGAEAMGGTYAVSGAQSEEGSHMIGVFGAERN